MSLNHSGIRPDLTDEKPGPGIPWLLILLVAAAAIVLIAAAVAIRRRRARMD